MDATVKRNIRDKFLEIFSRKYVYHGLLWMALLILLVVLDSNNYGFGFTVFVEFINLLFYALVVYFNLIYLIPNYLTNKKFLYYSGFLLLSILVITPVKIALFYLLFSIFPEMQLNLINNQVYYFLSTLIVVGASTIIKIISDWQIHMREKQVLETQTMQSELKFLKSQINPHFLFNTLNNLYALTLKKSDDAPKIVIKLSEMMRYMLYECNEKRVPLQKEVHYIENYIELEKLRQPKDIEIDFEVIGAVKEQRIAPLIFIPFIENSFKHGLHAQLKKGYVNIRLDVDRNKIHFFIENSKANQLPKTTHSNSGGIGLINVKRRLDILYPEIHKLDIRDNPSSYTVDLDINLKN